MQSRETKGRENRLAVESVSKGVNLSKIWWARVNEFRLQSYQSLSPATKDADKLNYVCHRQLVNVSSDVMYLIMLPVYAQAYILTSASQNALKV